MLYILIQPAAMIKAYEIKLSKSVYPEFPDDKRYIFTSMIDNWSKAEATQIVKMIITSNKFFWMIQWFVGELKSKGKEPSQ